MAWNAGFNLLRDGLQFVTMLVLVRLLPPAAYGQFGFVTSVIGFISIFSFSNFIAHLVQVRDDKDAHFQDHFTAGAALNLGMCGVTNLIAFAFRWFPASAAVTPLLHVMSITFLLEWPCNLRIKMIERELNWRKLRTLHAIGLLLTATMAVCMAFAGLGSYALLVPGMAVTLPFIYDLFVRKEWRPNWKWSWQRYQPSFHFGVTRIGSGLLVNGRQLMESSAFVSILGFASLGILNRSLGLAQLFCGRVAVQLLYAIYPILTRIEEKEGSASRVGALVIQTIAWTAIPLATAFAILADPFVKFVYGEKWLQVIPLVPWAMAWGVGVALFHATYMLLLARHQQRRCLVADAVVLIGTAVALFSALPHGMIHYLIAATGVQILGLSLVTFWLWRADGIMMTAWVKQLCPAAIGSAGSAIVIWPLIGRRDGSIPIVVAIALGTVFMIVYTLSLRFLFRNQLLLLLPYLPARGYLQKVLLLPA